MTRTQLRFPVFTSAALLLAGLYIPARAQDPDDLKRGVGRISLMNGQVSVQRGDSGDWVAGVINAPLIAGDRVATAENSRAEVQFDSSNMLRMGASAEIHLTQLESSRYQMEFARGILTYRVLRPSDAAVEIDTPSVSVRPSRVGTYRVSVNEAGETHVTARSGSLEVFSPHGSQTVSSGQTLIARGDPSDPEYQIVAAVGFDEWDRWNDSRDRQLMQSASPQRVGPGVSGAEDLDGYGNWVDVDGYGEVWQPTVAPDWAPYEYGRWSWLDWYGWTWVSNDPWGWAPYHYGRWFHHDHYGWLWYPGVRGARHYWSPGLVAFFGFGGGVNLGFGFGFGHVGWVPLAPYEVFHPWWGRGYYGGFNRNLNISSVNIAAVYRNARVRNGVSSLAAEDFRNGRFGNLSHPGSEQLRTAGLIRGQVGIAPTRTSLQYSARSAAFTPRTAASTRFFTHQSPPAVDRLPFAQQQRAMEPGTRPGGAATGGRLSGPGIDRPATAGGPAAVNRPSGTGPAATAPGGTNGGFRRFGAPGTQSGAPAGWNSAQRPASQDIRPSVQPSGGASSNGYRRFGSPGSAPPSSAPAYNSPQARPNPPSYSGPSRGSAPSYSAPSRPAPSYSPPARSSAPSYSAPSRGSAPSYSAPSRSSGGGGGGGGGSRPSSGGGGGSHHR